MKKTRQNVQREGRFLAAVSAEVSRAMASVDLSSSVIDLDGVRDDAAAALVEKIRASGGHAQGRRGRRARRRMRPLPGPMRVDRGGP